MSYVSKELHPLRLASWHDTIVYTPLLRRCDVGALRGEELPCDMPTLTEALDWLWRISAWSGISGWYRVVAPIADEDNAYLPVKMKMSWRAGLLRIKLDFDGGETKAIYKRLKGGKQAVMLIVKANKAAEWLMRCV